MAVVTESGNAGNAAGGEGFAAAETPSGKGAGDENFPVGSFLLPKPLRPHVATFYAFARAIDDIADNPELSSEEKISRLKALARAPEAAPAKGEKYPGGKRGGGEKRQHHGAPS